MTDFSLEDLLAVFQICEHPFRAVCLLATQLGHKSDRNELADILNIVNSWTPLEERIKRGKIKNALARLEAVHLISSEQDRFGKTQRWFYQITNYGQATLLFLLGSSGFLTTLKAATLQDSWEKVNASAVLKEALSFTLEKVRPYRELHLALKNRSLALPTTAKKYFLVWKPEKIFGTKTSERIKFFECLIWEHFSVGAGFTSKEIDLIFPDLPRAANKVKKLEHFVDVSVLHGERLNLYRLSSIALQSLFALGLMIVESDSYRKAIDPRPLLLPPAQESQMNRHLVSNALNFFRELVAGPPALSI
jgi:DNA-binding PadR family transcriptional regulator